MIRIKYIHAGVTRMAVAQILPDGELEFVGKSEVTPGIGDTVAAVTTAAGIKPCGGCKKRQAALNKATPGWLSRILLRSSQLVDRLKARVWKR
tara:strand:+ start:778 stop:1056 length:279 start_codon:yes stop_codon:yes gene_type:complete